MRKKPQKNRTAKEKEKLKFEKLHARYGSIGLYCISKVHTLAKLEYEQYLLTKRTEHWDRVLAIIADLIAVGFITATFFCGIVMMIPGLAFALLATECTLEARIDGLRAQMISDGIYMAEEHLFVEERLAKLQGLTEKKGTKKCQKK